MRIDNAQELVMSGQDMESIGNSPEYLPLNHTIIDQLVTLLNQDNWPAVFSDLNSTRPNLARIVCAIDSLIPHENGEVQNVQGIRILINEPLRSYRKPSYWVTSIPSSGVQATSDTSPSNNRPIIAQLAKTFFSTYSPPRQPETTVKNSAETPEGVSLDQRTLMQRLVRKILTDSPNLQIEARNMSPEIADMTYESANRVLKKLLGQPAQQDNTRNVERLHKEIISSHPLRKGQITLPHAIRRGALLLCAPLAEFYVAVCAALTLRSDLPLVTHRFAVACEDEIMTKQGEANNAPNSDGSMFIDTFCPRVSRQVMENNDEPHFQINNDGTQLPIDDVATVIDYVFTTAKQHFMQCQAGENVPANECYPLMVYKTLAKALGTEVPAQLIEHENQTENKIKNNQLVVTRNKAANKARIARMQEETRIKNEKKAQELALLCVKYSASHPNFLGNLYDAVPANSAENTIEYPHLLQCSGNGPELFHTIQGMLNNTRNHQQVSSVFRSLDAIQKGQRFSRDNDCWLRAIWISVLDQIEHPAEFNLMFSKLKLNEQTRPSPLPVLMEALLDDFKNNRNELLHRGEVGGLDRDAHFMAGRSVGDYLTSKGKPTDFYKEFALNNKIELVLRRLSKNLAMGVRGTEKPRFDARAESINMPGTMMDSEYVVAVHRVIEKPCFVLERSMNNQISLLFSGRKDDQELKDISFALEQKTNTGTPKLEDLAPLFNKYADIPVILLNAEHFTVYLPKIKSRYVSPQPVAAQPMVPQRLPTIMEEPMPSSPHSVADSSSKNGVIHVVYQEQAFPMKAHSVDFGATGESLVGQTPADYQDTILNTAKLFEQADQRGTAEFFEYISPLARVSPEKSKHPGLISQLKSVLEQQQRNQRYLEINGKLIVGIQSQRLPSDPEWVDRYAIEYVDKANPQQRRFVSVVQAAPDFSTGYLNAEQLTQSLKALKQNDSVTGGKRHLFSAMGLGRSAALAVLEKAEIAIRMGLITEPEQITTWLNEAKASGVRDRGQHFLSNRSQMIELQKATLMLLQKHQLGQAT